MQFDAIEINILQAAKAEIEARLGPCDISLFGSRARRDHRPNSDFDLLVIPKNDGIAAPNAERIWEVENVVRERLSADPKLNLQLVPQVRLEDLYFEWPFLPNALREGINLTEIN